MKILNSFVMQLIGGIDGFAFLMLTIHVGVETNPSSGHHNVSGLVYKSIASVQLNRHDKLSSMVRGYGDICKLVDGFDLSLAFDFD